MPASTLLQALIAGLSDMLMASPCRAEPVVLSIRAMLSN